MNVHLTLQHGYVPAHTPLFYAQARMVPQSVQQQAASQAPKPPCLGCIAVGTAACLALGCQLQQQVG